MEVLGLQPIRSLAEHRVIGFLLGTGFLESNYIDAGVGRAKQENGTEVSVLQPIQSLAEPRVIGSRRMPRVGGPGMRSIMAR